jgi:hypothetical protein
MFCSFLEKVSPAVDIITLIFLRPHFLMWLSDLQYCCLYYSGNGDAFCGHLTCSAIAFTTVVTEMPSVDI